MATAKKPTKKLPIAKSKTAGQVEVSKKIKVKKKLIIKSTKKAISKRALPRKDFLEVLYPSNQTKAEKLNKVLLFTETEIYDLVRRKIVEAFTMHEYGFDSFIEWLASREGDKFFNENESFSSKIVEDILDRAKMQFEDDKRNENFASLTKTASCPSSNGLRQMG
jgi:hypothetical protein